MRFQALHAMCAGLWMDCNHYFVSWLTEFWRTMQSVKRMVIVKSLIVVLNLSKERFIYRNVVFIELRNGSVGGGCFNGGLYQGQVCWQAKVYCSYRELWTLLERLIIVTTWLGQHLKLLHHWMIIHPKVQWLWSNYLPFKIRSKSRFAVALVASNATMDGGKMQRSSDKYCKQEARERGCCWWNTATALGSTAYDNNLSFCAFLRGHCQDHKIANLLGSLAEASQKPNKSPEHQGMEVEIWWIMRLLFLFGARWRLLWVGHSIKDSTT